MYYVYLLKLIDGKYYTGFSSDLKQRFIAHTNGNVSQTRKLRPIELSFYTCFESKIKALNFEKYLKSSSGFAFRNKHLINK